MASLSVSSSVSPSDTSSRRRALHFDTDSTSRASPLRPIVTRPGRNRGHLHRVDPYSRGSAHQFQPDLSASTRYSLDETISVASSITSSSGTSSNSLNSLSSSSPLPLFARQAILPTKKTVKATSQDVTRSRSRSLTWSKAINAGIGSGSVGVGIGSINHHHPLKEDALPDNAVKTSALTMPNLNAIARQRGLSAAVQYTIKLQGRKISSAMSSQQKFQFTRTQRLMVFIVPCLLLVLGSSSPPGAKHIVKKLDSMTKQPDFSWKPNRRLQNRACVLNMFIEKQAPDEFNPDFEDIKPGEKDKDGKPKLPGPPKMEMGTYRTKGQVEVILRFISSVADSFRPNIDMQQHLVFTGSRDGGHLAEEALKFWPPRGKYLTKLYVISDHENAPSVKPRDHSNRALQYGPLDVIEERFQNHAKSQDIHIFDFSGQKAGLVNSQYDDDDVAQLVEEEMFHMEDDTFGSDVASVDDDIAMDTADIKMLEESEAGYFSLKKLLHPYLERDDEANQLGFSSSHVPRENRTQHVIPYFHVDGTHAAQQFQILQSARPLIQDGTISIIGIENSRDLDVNDLIDFFHGVGFKTFLLGKRQVMRIDHLCPEILDDLMSHSYIQPTEVGFSRRILERLKLVKPDLHAHMKHPHDENHLLFPAFFVGFPRGRVSKEEMTIQHMYDLFGGGGGGGQIATANDRKVPQKKKK